MGVIRCRGHKGLLGARTAVWCVFFECLAPSLLQLSVIEMIAAGAVFSELPPIGARGFGEIELAHGKPPVNGQKGSGAR
ncbi:hypothetical protein RA23_20990 [Leisingera sp. ANG-S3]|nr:hypothetical protein RA23_20990 [Leisingera sp. ANG-S3]